jgi:hypothetical protein
MSRQDSKITCKMEVNLYDDSIVFQLGRWTAENLKHLSQQLTSRC